MEKRRAMGRRHRLRIELRLPSKTPTLVEELPLRGNRLVAIEITSKVEGQARCRLRQHQFQCQVVFGVCRTNAPPRAPGCGCSQLILQEQPADLSGKHLRPRPCQQAPSNPCPLPPHPRATSVCQERDRRDPGTSASPTRTRSLRPLAWPLRPREGQASSGSASAWSPEARTRSLSAGHFWIHFQTLWFLLCSKPTNESFGLSPQRRVSHHQ